MQCAEQPQEIINETKQAEIQKEEKLDRASWMRWISDEILIENLSIPGTHNSGTSTINTFIISAFAKCQERRISEQVRDGIRFLDIRINNDSELKIGHGVANAEINFGNVLSDCVDFLKENPTEFLLMLIEINEGNWDAAMAERVNQTINNVSEFIFDFENSAANLPTKVADARGKIVLLKRSAACPMGYFVPFQNNKNFVSNRFNVSDCYEVAVEEKQQFVAENLKKAMASTAEFYLTYNSRAFEGLKTPRDFADSLNPWLRDLIKGKNDTKLGVIALDFYTQELCEAIILSNFSTDFNFKL